MTESTAATGGSESPERFAEWENAAIGDTVTLLNPDMPGACDGEQWEGQRVLLCTRDRGHAGQHVATGLGVVYAKWPAG